MLPPNILVDCRHVYLMLIHMRISRKGNLSFQVLARIRQVVRDIAGRIAKGEQGITGIMMESFIEGGNQKAAPLDHLVYGKSITDKCLSWNTTEQLLRELAHAVAVRRWK